MELNEQQRTYIKLALFMAGAICRKKGIVITNMPEGIPDVVCQQGKHLDASFAVILPKKTWQELNADWSAAKDNDGWVKNYDETEAEAE